MGFLRQAARAARLLRAQGPVAFGRMAAHQLRRAASKRSSALPFLRETPPTGDLLGMTTPEEQSFLYWYARDEYVGSGALVDLGCWLGSSTLPLAAGLAANPRVDSIEGRIHAFDLFRWESWMEDSVAGTALANRLEPGDSFRAEFEDRTRAYRDAIVVEEGDLLRKAWPAAVPIEFLFNDASKTFELALHIQRTFVPALVPGRSLVVEQDFAHYFTPWVHLLRFRLRDWFEPVFHVPYSGSMVFRIVRMPPRERLDPEVGYADFPDSEIEAAFNWSLALVDPPMRANVWAARVMWEVHQGKLDRASRLFRDGARRGLRGLDLEKVRPLLAAAS